MLLLAVLVGCKDAELEEENARLKQRVTDLERARDRLERDNEALKAQASRAAKEAEASRRTELFSSLGLGEGKSLHATLVTSMGDIRCTLRPEQAPNSVLNFVQLARGEKEWTDPNTGEKTKRPLYDGTIFHRVIPDFMIQGGDPLGNGTGGPGYEFEDEVGEFTTFDHPGILAMANAGPDTQGSQFFVTEGTPTHLNGKHTILGDCENLDVVAKIARVPRSRPGDRPETDVVLKTVKVEVK
ncbi:MAG: peptidylprolyl isomerase [Myxococcota bacterium]